MPAPKKPADHEEKKESIDEMEDYFSFEAEGETYMMPRKTRDVMTPGWVRKNRRRDETDYFMTILECLASDYEGAGAKLTKEEAKAGEEAMGVIDNLSWDEHRKLQEELAAHIRVTMGE